MADIKIYAKPSSLYRYRPLSDKLEQEIDAIANGYIFCPKFSSMNDPMEGAHGMSMRFLSNPNSVKSKQRVQAALQNMGIACFSEVHDHEPMWAHYAGQFSGMCIQYSLNRLLKGLPKDAALTRMMYSEAAPVMLNDASNSEDRARLCLSSKTVRWASEREWRLFQSTQGPASYGQERAITKIYLGSRVSEDDAKRVKKEADRLRLPISRMIIDNYSISFKTVPILMGKSNAK